MKYKPKPTNTFKIKLGDDIKNLKEKLAENTHEIWAEKRIAEGWTSGSKRNDQHKKHPCLVPYEDLPESEKEYDRKMAMETLKVIKSLGYKIEKIKKD
jgi:hypothetical protein